MSVLQTPVIRWILEVIFQFQVTWANCLSWNCRWRGGQCCKQGPSPFLSWSMALSFHDLQEVNLQLRYSSLPQKTSWYFTADNNFSCSFCRWLQASSDSCRAEWPGWEHSTWLHSNLIVALGVGQEGSLLQLNSTGLSPCQAGCQPRSVTHESMWNLWPQWRVVWLLPEHLLKSEETCTGYLASRSRWQFINLGSSARFFSVFDVTLCLRAIENFENSCLTAETSGSESYLICRVTETNDDGCINVQNLRTGAASWAPRGE